MFKTKTKGNFRLKWLRFLEEELFSLLALALVFLFSLYSRAAVAPATLVVFDAAATITVLTPNGGETWVIGQAKEITWEATGDVPEIKIELSRDNGESYETIAETTTNDGSYLWTVTGSVAPLALIKISDVYNADNFDLSNLTFAIEAEAPPAPSGGGGGFVLPARPEILSALPGEIFRQRGGELLITGRNFQSGAKVRVGNLTFTPRRQIASELAVWLEPLSLPAGVFDLVVINPDSQTAILKDGLRVVDGLYDAKLAVQTPASPLKLEAGQTLTLTVGFRNTGTFAWTREGTDQIRLKVVPPDEKSVFFDRGSWLDQAHPALLQTALVPPGSIGDFSFRIQAPAETGLYQAKFRLVDRAENYFGEETVWEIEVTERKPTLLERILAPIMPGPRPGAKPPPAAPVAPQPSPLPPSPGQEIPLQPFLITFLAGPAGQLGLLFSLALIALFFLLLKIKWFQALLSPTLRWVEGELLSVLAVVFVLLLSVYSRAATETTTMSLTVFDGDAIITVLFPNGGETWTIAQAKEITWEITGDVPEVKIELTRNGSTYETLASSTANDGSYLWTVTGPAASSAKIKISDVLNPDNYDESNSNFTIAAASEQPGGGGGGGGGGGYVYSPPTAPPAETPPPVEGDVDVIKIISLQPREFYSSLGTILKIRGVFGRRVTLRLADVRQRPVFSVDLTPRITQISAAATQPEELILTIEIKPHSLPPGEYDLSIKEGDEQVVSPMVVKVLGGKLSARWVRQSDYPTVAPGEEFELWVEFRNTGTIPWLKEEVPGVVKLGTSRPRDRSSRFYHLSWLSKNRLTLIDQGTPPGNIGRFTFKMKAPARPGTYREYVEPVAEYSTWIGPDWGVYWNIRVEKPKLSLRRTVSKLYRKAVAKVAPKAPSSTTSSQVASQSSLIARLFNALLSLFGRGLAGSGVRTGD